jgi:23S rRNA pseudouridine2457 synthase
MSRDESKPHRYLLFNKPYAVLTTFTDPDGRATLADYVPVSNVYAAGRLDRDSEGLLLLTNDGRLAHRLTHPRHKLPKTYWVQIENIPNEEALHALRSGIIIQGRRTAAAQVSLMSEPPALPPRSVPIRVRAHIPTCWLRIVLREGRKRQIRHMTAAVGHPTLRLVRIGIGPLTLDLLQPGQWRDLASDELAALRRALNSTNRRRNARSKG